MTISRGDLELRTVKSSHFNFCWTEFSPNEIIACYDVYIYHLLYDQVMARVVIKCNANGPNLITVDGTVFAAMCRCGASNSKPYCDGTHGKIGFKAEPTEITVLE